MTRETSGQSQVVPLKSAFGRFQLNDAKREEEAVQVEAPSLVPRFISGPLETLLLAGVLGAVLIGGWLRNARQAKTDE